MKWPKAIVLRVSTQPDEVDWHFSIPTSFMSPQLRQRRMLKITLCGAASVPGSPPAMPCIKLDTDSISSNRVVHADDCTKFVLLTVDRTFRFPDHPPKTRVEYLNRMFAAGVFLNGVQYRFYHHSNSQLRGRSCYLRQANTDEELDHIIYAMGDFARINNVAKRAKRIGLLFSSAEIDFNLNPSDIEDIEDIEIGGEVFSDGCGLISQQLAKHIAKAKGILFRGVRYTPTVIQIRYLGYKGVLAIHPDLDKRNAAREPGSRPCHAQFRKSMKKFKASPGDTSFSVVGYSKPYSFGRLNNDIITLIHSLGVTTESLVGQQQEYFDWISDAIKFDTHTAATIDFLSCLDQYAKAEQILLQPDDDEHRTRTVKQLRAMQMEELSRHHDTETQKFKTRMIIHKSRRLFGVCDPYQVLKEGQVHVRITLGRKGKSTPIHGDVLVVRNPCLYPGDCLKLRAVSCPELDHLVDCLVFASSIRKPGNKPAPSMSSGGDLDGDEFFVCWDPDLVPPNVAESYDYPPNREPRAKKVTRADLANHFASYNTSGLARVSALHNKWAMASPAGALCVECQELNALHSQSVDGAAIRIPEKLLNPPEPKERFIIDILREHEERFEAEFRQSPEVDLKDLVDLDAEHAQRHVEKLFKSNQRALSEYELFELALRLSRKHGFDLKPFLTQLDVSALTAMQKNTIMAVLDFTKVDYPCLWNSLFQSDILSADGLRKDNLDLSISLQKLYSSRASSQATFFEYLRRATQDYTRKLLLIRTDPRFAVGIFMRGEILWDEESEVDENVVVVSFLGQSSATPPPQKACSKGYRLHCSYGRLQLYNRHIGDTFIDLKRAPREHESEVIVSIALQKISGIVQMQIGRVRTVPLSEIELHVVSNHDTVAQDLFDLWWEHVPTEKYIPRFVRKPEPYRANDLRDVDWEPPAPVKQEDQSDEDFTNVRRAWLQRTDDLQIIYYVLEPYLNDLDAPAGRYRHHHSGDTMRRVLMNVQRPQLDAIMDFTVTYHAEEETFLVFSDVISRSPLDLEFVSQWIGRCPALVFPLVKHFPPGESREPGEDRLIHPALADVTTNVLEAIVKSANETRIATLVALEKLASTIAHISTKAYCDLLLLVAHSARSKSLAQELLLVIHESRMNFRRGTPSKADVYLQKHSLNIVCDRMEEAADECPCNDDGQPRRQRTAPAQVKLKFSSDGDRGLVKATVRVDAKYNVRLHSHVRLKGVSKAENRWLVMPVLDGIVTQFFRGEFAIQLTHPAPPELESMDWVIYDAGSTATTEAMLTALINLVLEQHISCSFSHLIIGDDPPEKHEAFDSDSEDDDPTPRIPAHLKGKGREDEAASTVGQPLSIKSKDDDGEPECGFDASSDFIEPQPASVVLPEPDSHQLNSSQMAAVASWTRPLSLIWGPPGTGKTTVVVQILRSIVRTFGAKLPAILMTASTHNAVDNVLERFININESEKLVPKEKILRVATDQSRVGDALLEYTLDARVGGDINQNRKRMKEAENRVKRARLVFTTCAGAGLGVLRKFRFSIVIIDEASQITEPCALIPLVKGAKKAVMVGDHVQLRPTVGKLGKVFESDVSLLERLYTGPDVPGICKTMLDVQYRSPRALNAFPSQEFYDDKLRTAESNDVKLSRLNSLLFPWPRAATGHGAIVPAVFIQCSVEEDMGGRSKSNEGQVDLVVRIEKLLRRKPDLEGPDSEEDPLEVTVLSPYRGQNVKLRQRLPSSVPVATVDGFQGRESDVVIFSTVRCNIDDTPTSAIGFLDDPRRLNVMWTRARLALIIVGDKETLSRNSQLWKRAIDACTEAKMDSESQASMPLASGETT